MRARMQGVLIQVRHLSILIGLGVDALVLAASGVVSVCAARDCELYAGGGELKGGARQHGSRIKERVNLNQEVGNEGEARGIESGEINVQRSPTRSKNNVSTRRVTHYEAGCCAQRHEQDMVCGRRRQARAYQIVPDGIFARVGV